MFKFNIFAPGSFMWHKVTLSCSPIDRDRYEAELRERIDNTSYNHPNSISKSNKIPTNRCLVDIKITNQPHMTIFWAILHPLRVIQLIKKYHLVGNTVVICYLTQIIMLLHLAVKMIIHTIITGTNRDTVAYFDSIYYPILTSNSNQPTLFNNLLTGMSIFCLSIRLRSFYKLIRNSILNAIQYEELSVTQLNLAYYSTFNLNIHEWLELWNFETKHKRFIESSHKRFINHLELNQSAMKQSTRLPLKDSMYYVNLLDYDECYASSVLKDTKRRQKLCKSWHVATPIDRLSLSGIKVMILTAVIGNVVVLFGFQIAIVALMYLEFSNKFSHKNNSGLSQTVNIVSTHFQKLSNLIRIVELLAITTSQILQIFDSIVIISDIHILKSRIEKLTKIFEVELKKVRFIQDERNGYLKTTDYSKLHQPITSLPRVSVSFQDINENVRNINVKTRYNAKLVRLIYLEFLNIKQNHSQLLDMIVIGNGICMSYALTLLFAFKTYADIILVLMTFASCLSPTVTALLYCAMLERKVGF